MTDSAELVAARNAANTAVAKLLKAFEFKRPEDKEIMRARIERQVTDLYADKAGVAITAGEFNAIMAEELKKALPALPVVSREADAQSEIARNEELAKGTAPIGSKLLSKSSDIGNKASAFLDKEKMAPNIRLARKLIIMQDLRLSLPGALGQKDAKTQQAAVEAAIFTVLKDASNAPNDTYLKTDAAEMAQAFIATDKTMTDDLNTLMTELKITDPAKRTAIITSVRKRVLENMTRSDGPSAEGLGSIFTDSIEKYATPTAQIALFNMVQDTSVKVQSFTGQGGNKATADFLKANINGALGGGYNIGTGTVVGGGVGALVALAGPGDFETTKGILTKLVIAGGVTAAGVAYDQGAFDGLRKNIPFLKKDDKGPQPT